MKDYCKNCGALIKENSKFCHECGSPIESKTVKAKNKRFCENCGKTHDKDINAAINILNRWFNGDSLKKH